MKKLLVISDLHCGNVYGLTPESWQFKDNYLSYIQSDFWNWFKSKINEIKPIDFLVVNGDIIDGSKNDSIDLLTTDINKQIQIAVEVLKEINASKHFFIYGTPYHVVDKMEAEEIIADKFNSEIKSQLRLKINDFIFDFKHTTSKTSIPHGQGTLIAKKILWELLHSILEHTEKADYIIRSHIHEHCYIETPMGIGMTTPALQLPLTSYGRKYDGWYEVGFLLFEIDKKVEITKFTHTTPKREDTIET